MIPFKRIIPPITNKENIARRFSIKVLERLRELYGGDKWRKIKGDAHVEMLDGSVRYAEVHWYECHGIGKRQIKIKRFWD